MHFTLKSSIFQVKKFQTEDPELYTCDASNCDKNCEKPFVCNKIVGKILYSSTNQSKLTQIYASYEDIERRQGDVSLMSKLLSNKLIGCKTSYSFNSRVIEAINDRNIIVKL